MRNEVEQVIRESNGTLMSYLAFTYERWLTKDGLTPTRENFETFLAQHL